MLKKSIKLGYLHDWAGALDYCEKALMENDQHFLGWYHKGNILEALGRYVGAIAAYNKALTIEPSNSSVLFVKGGVLCKLGRYMDAIITYEKVSPNAPNRYAVLLQKSKTLGFIRRYPEALAACEQAIVADADNNIDALAYKGFLLAEMGQLKAAIATYDQVLSQRSEYFQAVLMLKSMALEDLGRYEEAEQVRDIAREAMENAVMENEAVENTL